MQTKIINVWATSMAMANKDHSHHYEVILLTAINGYRYISTVLMIKTFRLLANRKIKMGSTDRQDFLYAECQLTLDIESHYLCCLQALPTIHQLQHGWSPTSRTMIPRITEIHHLPSKMTKQSLTLLYQVHFCDMKSWKELEWSRKSLFWLV